MATAADLLGSGDDQLEGGVLEAIERAAQASAAQIGLAALAGVVDWAGTATPAHASCPDAGHDARLVARRTKTVRTLLGSIQTTRGYYHCATCRQGFAPLDQRLGVAGTSLSAGLARACALAGAEMPYDTSRRFIATVTGLDLASTSTLARTTRTQGERARDLITAERTAPGPVPGTDIKRPDLCYIVMDGTGAPMLPSQCQGRPGKDPAKHQGRAGTREVKIGCFFTQSGCDPDSGEAIQDPGSASYISTFEPAAIFAVHAKAEYHRRAFDQIRQPIVLTTARSDLDHRRRAIPRHPDRGLLPRPEHLADLTKTLAPVLADPAAFEQALSTTSTWATPPRSPPPSTPSTSQTAPDLVRPAATEVGYFTATTTACSTPTSAPTAATSAPARRVSLCNTIVKQRADEPACTDHPGLDRPHCTCTSPADTS